MARTFRKKFNKIMPGFLAGALELKVDGNLDGEIEF